MSGKQLKTSIHSTTVAIRKNNPGLRSLLGFWSQYCALTEWHEQWARRHIEVIGVKRGDVLAWEGDRQKTVYFVCSGMLGRISGAGAPAQRQITSLALPRSALTTTTHLYSSTLHQGDIVALRSGIIVAIPYKAIRAYKEAEPMVETLIDILINKKKRQLETHVQILRTTSPFQRYLLFDALMPEIQYATSQQEQAEFLGISRRTVQEACYFLLTGQRPRK